MKQRITVDIHAVDLPWYVDALVMSTADVGEMFRRIAREASTPKGRRWIKSLPFVGEVQTKQGLVDRNLPAHIRADVLSAGCCAHCGSTKRLEVDHIKPLNKGGEHARRNLQCLCKRCNVSKRDRWTG